MSFPRYPKYKDSGVEWLGQVPEHWEVTRLGYLCAKIGSGKTPSGGAEMYFEEGVTFIRSQNVYDEGLRLDDVVYIDTQIDEELRASRVRGGDILLNITGASLGRTCLVPDGLPHANVNQHVCIVRLHSVALRSFVALALKSHSTKIQIQAAQNGAAREGLNFAQVSKLVLAIPPLAERTRIAEFLDREAGKIDELVAEQQRLMELLKEKRQAVVSHAVTKGLNPAVSMKPSGIEWLGDVPAHWKVGRCGFYMTILSGFAFPSSGFTDDEGETKLLRGVNVGVSSLRWDDTVYWRRTAGDDLDDYEIQKGDVVIGMDRPLISDGIRVAKVKAKDLPCLLLQRVASLKPGDRLNSDYLLSLLSSEMFVAHFSPETTGVSVPHISPEQIQNFVVPVPPIDEQETIVSFIHTETEKLDALTAEAQKTIDLLQERRIALISAAVTGQIDVRELAAS